MAGWIWNHMPRWAVLDPRVIRLEAEPRLVWHLMWASCDREGRGEADEMRVRMTLGLFREDVVSALDVLVRLKLIELVQVDGAEHWQLADYKRDAPRDVTRERRQGAGSRPAPSRAASSTVPDESRHPAGTLPGNVRHHAGQEPAPSRAEAGTVPGVARARKRQETGDRRQRSPSRAGGGAARDARPAPPPARDWPSDQHRGAAERWEARLGAAEPRLAELAASSPATFVRAVEVMLGASKGWGNRDPWVWLATQCRIEGEDAEDVSRPKRGRAGPAPPVPAAPPPSLWEPAAATLRGSVLRALEATGSRRVALGASIAETSDGDLEHLADLGAPPDVRADIAELVAVLALPPPDLAAWSAVTGQLAEQIGAYDVQHWIRPLTPVAQAEGELVLLAPDVTHSRWVEEQGWLDALRAGGVEPRFVHGGGP